jgi:hypothetical protein
MTGILPRYAQVALAGVGLTAIAFVFLRPRPTRLAMTQRVGDDTVVINQTRTTSLSASVFDQYGRRLAAGERLQYRWVAGDSIRVSRSGNIQCRERRDAVVRVTFAGLARDLILRCRPVAAIEAPTWLDLVVGDSTRSLADTMVVAVPKAAFRSKSNASATSADVLARSRRATNFRNPFTPREPCAAASSCRCL